MVNAYLANALIITLLVIIALITLWSILKIAAKIECYFKRKHAQKEYRLSLIERQISALQNNDEVHKNVINRHTERLDVLDEKLNKKETKKDVKKKKRN